MVAQEAAQSVPVSPQAEERFESRRLCDDILVTGNQARGYFLYRSLKDRMVPLRGATLDKAYGNAAMALIGATDIDALFKRPSVPVREPQPGVVYFVGGDVGGVKIGFAVNVELRLRDLQCGSPVKLAVLATVPGMPKDEREYHKRFKAARQHGEWFERTPELLAEIDRLGDAS